MPLPPRRPSVPVRVGHVTVGGPAPVVVQSMTNTDTADVESTVRQVRELALAGSEVVRVTVNEKDAAAAVPRIRERLDALGIAVPLVGDAADFLFKSNTRNLRIIKRHLDKHHPAARTIEG